jgi:cation diffusion facilitator CzcD-associated flavoprotein CzcO
MGTKDTTIAVLSDRLPDTFVDAAGVQLAAIVDVTDDGPKVQFQPDGPPITARLAVAVTRERLDAAIAQCQQVVLLFESGDRTRPIIVGFIESVPALAEPVDVRPILPDRQPVVEADVDGKRVRVTAQDEIVLQCGNASITLRRNGRVIIRGTYVESRSDGTNRIKGGQVQIN